MTNEQTQENMRDIFENLTATRGKEFAQVVALTCRAHAVIGMITNLPLAPGFMVAETAKCAATTLDQLISLLIDQNGLDPKEIIQWVDIVKAKGYDGSTTH